MNRKKNLFNRRRQRVRNRLMKNAGGRPRLSIHRTGKHIYAQVIDDVAGKTLATASTLDKELREQVKSGANVDAAKQVGDLIAKRATDAGIKDVVFDRGGFLYHGRIKALADAARDGGLNF